MFDSNTKASDVYAHARKVAEWLLGSRGFCRLEDSYEPEYFRLARCAAQMSVENRLTRFGRAQIPFECQPQRYLKLGETEVIIDAEKDGDLYYGTIAIESIPYGATAFYCRMNGSAPTLVSCVYRDENGNDIGSISETATPIAAGAVRITCGWNNATAETAIVVGMVDADGVETQLAAVVGTDGAVYNPTEYEARPLLKFVDTNQNQPIVEVSVTEIENAYISAHGTIQPVTWPTGLARNYKCSTSIGVGTYGYAYVSGERYAFYDANDNPLVISDLVAYNNEKVIVPQNASTIRVHTRDGFPEIAVSLQRADSNPGAYNVTINGVTIGLDFSTHDTIFLDCDLHDAYYSDGSSANGEVTFSSALEQYPTFPGLYPGNNIVSARENTNIRFSIVPRWWTL